MKPSIESNAPPPSSRKRERWAERSGVTLVETAILLPLTLAVMFIIIAIAVLFNARSSLSSGMSQALRLANTRANVALVGEKMLSPLNDYVDPNTQLASFSSIAELVSTNVSQADAAAFLNTCFAAVYQLPLSDLPPQYLYTLAYLKQALAQSIGPSLKFPCVPPGGQPPSGINQCQPPAPANRPAGCVSCYLLDPRDFDLDPSTPSSTSPPDPNPDRLIMRCEYSPASIFIQPILSLLNLFSGGSSGGGSSLTITRDRVFEVTRSAQ